MNKYKIHNKGDKKSRKEFRLHTMSGQVYELGTDDEKETVYQLKEFILNHVLPQENIEMYGIKLMTINGDANSHVELADIEFLYKVLENTQDIHLLVDERHDKSSLLDLNQNMNYMEKLYRLFQYFSVAPRSDSKSYFMMIKALSSAVMHIENPECKQKSEDERKESAERDDATIDNIMCYLSNAIIPAPTAAETIVDRQILSDPDNGATQVGLGAYGAVYLLRLKKQKVAVKVPLILNMEMLIEATVGLVITNTLIRKGLLDRHRDLARVLPFYGVFSCDAPKPMKNAARQPTLPICVSAGGTGPVLYTVMKRMDIPTLKTVLEGEKITLEQVDKVVKQVWSLLIVLNESALNFVHNDIHTDNIFVDLSGSDPVATIFDYGLSSFTLDGIRVYGKKEILFIEHGIRQGESGIIRENPSMIITGLEDIIQLIRGIYRIAKGDIRQNYQDKLRIVYDQIKSSILPSWPSFEKFEINPIVLDNDPDLPGSNLLDTFRKNLSILNGKRHSDLAVSILGFDGGEVARLKAIGKNEISGWFV